MESKKSGIHWPGIKGTLIRQKWRVAGPKGWAGKQAGVKNNSQRQQTGRRDKWMSNTANKHLELLLKRLKKVAETNREDREHFGWIQVEGAHDWTTNSGWRRPEKHTEEGWVIGTKHTTKIRIEGEGMIYPYCCCDHHRSNTYISTLYGQKKKTMLGILRWNYPGVKFSSATTPPCTSCPCCLDSISQKYEILIPYRCSHVWAATLGLG